MKKADALCGLCTEAYHPDGKRRLEQKAKPLACAECESPCQYGLELLKMLNEKTFRSLLCGAECTTCRQPCNLWRVAQMRDLKPLPTQREAMEKGWIETAMRPYNEKHRNGGAENATVHR